jgi:hypothetical protein
MSRFSLLLLYFIVLTSCDKDPYEDLSTSFQGIVYSAPEEPMANGQIVISGRRSWVDDCCGEAFRESFQTESDGTFNIRVNTNDVASFSIDIPSSEQRCTGPSISGVCTLMEAGEKHSDIIIYAY